VDKVKNKNFF